MFKGFPVLHVQALSCLGVLVWAGEGPPSSKQPTLPWAKGKQKAPPPSRPSKPSLAGGAGPSSSPWVPASLKKVRAQSPAPSLARELPQASASSPWVPSSLKKRPHPVCPGFTPRQVQLAASKPPSREVISPGSAEERLELEVLRRMVTDENDIDVLPVLYEHGGVKYSSEIVQREWGAAHSPLV